MNGLDLRELMRSLLHALDWHRRLVSAVLVGIAAAVALTVLTPHPAPTRAVWTAARDLAGGQPLSADDLTLTRVPVPLVPSGALRGVPGPVGRLLAAPVRRGEPLTDVRLLEPPLLSALGSPGDVAVPVRLADGAAAAAVVHPGEVVDVLAAGDVSDAPSAAPAGVVATAVTVLAVPQQATTSGSDAGIVVVAASPAQATALAAASAGRRLSLALRRP